MIGALAWLALAVVLAGPVGFIGVWSLASVIAGAGRMRRRKEKNDGNV